ncbi:MAG: helix-turn-helix domain-containing protein [Oxalobacter formigenes]|nr:helix-turn-helix domain-containing protein [Oxalobacter formigenes]
MLDYISALASAIKNRRKELGLTQDEAAGKAAIAPRTIPDIENRKDNPRLSTLFGIVRVLKMDANDIFYPEIKHGTYNQVKLQTMFADCFDSEADLLYEVCTSILSSLRKREYSYIETQNEKEPAFPLV